MPPEGERQDRLNIVILGGAYYGHRRWGYGGGAGVGIGTILLILLAVNALGVYR